MKNKIQEKCDLAKIPIQKIFLLQKKRSYKLTTKESEILWKQFKDRITKFFFHLNYFTKFFPASQYLVILSC